MKFLLNIGNTHAGLWQFDPESGKISAFRVFLTASLQADDLPAGEIAAVTVVPELRDRLLPRGGITFYDVFHHSGKVDFSCGDCSTLGSDRLANALALSQLYPLPGVVVDCGTAITMEVVDENAVFCGGIIAPGRMLMRKSLSAGTAQLPEVPLLSAPPEDISTGTVNNISFGIDRGIVGVIRETLAVIREKHAVKSVVFTGGDMEFFLPSFPDAAAAPEYFTAYGIALAANWL